MGLLASGRFVRRAVFIVVALAASPRHAGAQGEPIGPEFRVNAYTTFGQIAPRVAADPSGNFVVVWVSYAEDGSGNGVFGQRYSATGAPAGPEFRVNTSTFASQSLPIAAADPSGNFVVAWMSFTTDGSSWGTYGQRYGASGAPLGPEFRANTYLTGSQASPSLASDSTGGFVIVWQGDAQDGSSYGIFGQRYDSTGTPLGPEFLVNTYTTGRQADPSVASDSSGNFVVVWEGDAEDGSGSGVFGQRFASTGSALGPEFRVNEFTTGQQSDPIVAASSSGDFVVVWMSDGQDGSSMGAFGRRYAASGSPQGSEFRVNTYTPGYQGLPQVTADPAGNFVVAWQSLGQEGAATDAGVFAQRYAASGAALGPEFRVNTYTTTNQLVRGVAADPDGDFVVVWQSDTQDGSGYGVFAQRYGSIVPLGLTSFEVE